MPRDKRKKASSSQSTTPPTTSDVFPSGSPSGSYIVVNSPASSNTQTNVTQSIAPTRQQQALSSTQQPHIQRSSHLTDVQLLAELFTDYQLEHGQINSLDLAHFQAFINSRATPSLLTASGSQSASQLVPPFTSVPSGDSAFHLQATSQLIQTTQVSSSTAPIATHSSDSQSSSAFTSPEQGPLSYPISPKQNMQTLSSSKQSGSPSDASFSDSGFTTPNQPAPSHQASPSAGPITSSGLSPEASLARSMPVSPDLYEAQRSITHSQVSASPLSSVSAAISGNSSPALTELLQKTQEALKAENHALILLAISKYLQAILLPKDSLTLIEDSAESITTILATGLYLSKHYKNDLVETSLELHCLALVLAFTLRINPALLSNEHLATINTISEEPITDLIYIIQQIMQLNPSLSPASASSSVSSSTSSPAVSRENIVNETVSLWLRYLIHHHKEAFTQAFFLPLLSAKKESDATQAATHKSELSDVQTQTKQILMAVTAEEGLMLESLTTSTVNTPDSQSASASSRNTPLQTTTSASKTQTAAPDYGSLDHELHQLREHISSSNADELESAIHQALGKSPSQPKSATSSPAALRRSSLFLPETSKDSSRSIGTSPASFQEQHVQHAEVQTIAMSNEATTELQTQPPSQQSPAQILATHGGAILTGSATASQTYAEVTKQKVEERPIIRTGRRSRPG